LLGIADEGPPTFTFLHNLQIIPHPESRDKILLPYGAIAYYASGECSTSKTEAHASLKYIIVYAREHYIVCDAVYWMDHLRAGVSGGAGYLMELRSTEWYVSSVWEWMRFRVKGKGAVICAREQG